MKKVAIVGAGISGLYLANELNNTIVINRTNNPYATAIDLKANNTRVFINIFYSINGSSIGTKHAGNRKNVDTGEGPADGCGKERTHEPAQRSTPGDRRNAWIVHAFRRCPRRRPS